MKRFLAIILSFLFIILLVGCTPSADPSGDSLDSVENSVSEQPNNTNDTEVSDIQPDETSKPFKEEPKFDVWDGSVATSYAGGTGTQDDPYLIETGAQLAYFAIRVNAGVNYSNMFISLENNLDLNNIEWAPIGSGTYHFQGTFDGGNHIIRNIKIVTAVRTKYSYSSTGSLGNGASGLFGICENANIHNLKIDNINIDVPSNLNFDRIYVGALAGRVESSNYLFSQFTNIKISNATVNVSQYECIMNIGGCIGLLYVSDNGWFESDSIQCMSTLSGLLNDSKNYFGGIAGYVETHGYSEFLNFACYTDVYWPTSTTENYLGAFGALNSFSGDTKLENGFAKITPSTKTSQINHTAYVISGKLYNSAEPLGNYVFKNIYGNITYPRSGQTSVYLSRNYSSWININSSGCTTLPSNHGLPESIWDLSSLSNPVLK